MQTSGDGQAARDGTALSGACVRLSALLSVFLLFLAVRAIFLFPVLRNDTPPKFDEQAYYSRAVALLVLGALVFGGLAYYLLVLKGLLTLGNRKGSLPYVAAFGSTRFNLPQMALPVPLAGAGWARFGERSKAYPFLPGLVVLFLAVLFYRSYPDHFYAELRPSSPHCGALGPLDRLHGTESLYRDVFSVQTVDKGHADRLKLTVTNKDGSDYYFSPRGAVHRMALDLGREREEEVSFKVYSRWPAAPLEIGLRTKEGARCRIPAFQIRGMLQSLF